ncbi:MAG: DUF3881 family protein, partial [Eubacterium sp.]|nr:DUF3881 family protein [Eubacterium sp.]
MHRFLRSVGFSNLTEIEDQDKLLQDVLVNHDAKNVVRMENGQLFAEISREFAPDIGITVCGQYDRENLFRMEYYYPYFRSSKSTTYKNIGVERHYATRSFAAACDDARVGTTLIFYLTNAAQYLDSAAKKIPMPET